MYVQVLGAHHCESRDSKFVSLLIDDVLAIDAGALTSSLSFTEQQKLTTILLTHQHYDHIKDIPAIAMNALLHNATIDVRSIQAVYDALTTYLLNDKIYPDFFKKPPDNPTIKFTLIEPHQPTQIGGYSILAIPVNHSVPTVGYQITSTDGKILFFTSDTGPGLADCWKCVSPQLIIIEVTASNRYEDFCLRTGHLTPNLLEQELSCFRELKGYLPPIIAIHMNPDQDKEIEAEIAAIAKSSDCPVSLAYEGMRIQL